MTTNKCRILRRTPIVSNPTRVIERCIACKTAPWTCRRCATPCCEHRASELDAGDRSCLCGKCSLKGRRQKV